MVAQSMFAHGLPRTLQPLLLRETSKKRAFVADDCMRLYEFCSLMVRLPSCSPARPPARPPAWVSVGARAAH